MVAEIIMVDNDSGYTNNVCELFFVTPLYKMRPVGRKKHASQGKL